MGMIAGRYEITAKPGDGSLGQECLAPKSISYPNIVPISDIRAPRRADAGQIFLGYREPPAGWVNDLALPVRAPAGIQSEQPGRRCTVDCG